MKIFLHLLLIGLVLSLMSTAPAISYEFDEELSPDVTYQVLNATLEAAKAKGVGTSSYEKHIQSIEKDDSLNARQKQIALNDIYDALKRQLKLSRRSTIGDGAWSNFSHALFEQMPTYQIVPESASVLNVTFVLHRDGSVSNPRQLSSSGISKLDYRVMAKLKKIRHIPEAKALFEASGQLQGDSDCLVRLGYMPGQVMVLCFRANGAGRYFTKPYTITFFKERCFLPSTIGSRSAQSRERPGMSTNNNEFVERGPYPELIGPTLKDRFR